MARWYDDYPKLAHYLDCLKSLNADTRDKIITDLMFLIKKNSPTLFDRFVQDFPLGLRRQRWYDKDPYLWIIFNGLKYADKPLLEAISNYFEEL